MKVKVNSKSNFKNCNDIWLDVLEISGNRITVDIPQYGFNLNSEQVGNFGTKADFNVSEIKEFNLNAYNKETNKKVIGQLQYEISLLDIDRRNLVGVDIRTEELKDLM